MAETSETERRILEAFLRLVRERGIVGTTTRAIAEAAGVNEVTVFRRFKDKEALVHAVFRHFDLPGQIQAYRQRGPLEISSPQKVVEGLRDALEFLKDLLQRHAALLQFGISEYQKFPSITVESAAAPQAARHLISDLLKQASPVLRSEVDQEATTLSLMGLLLLTVLWNQNGWLEQSEAQWKQSIAAAIRPLIDWKQESR